MNRAIAILGAAMLLAGCVTPPATENQFDTSALSKAGTEKATVLSVTFMEYAGEEDALFEKAWAEAKGPTGEAGELWAANGLRIAGAEGKQGEKIRAILKRATTVGNKAQKAAGVTGSPMEVVFGPTMAEMGLIYATKDGTTIADATAFQLALKAVLVGKGEDRRVSITPYFYSGKDIKETWLEGAEAQFGVGDGSVILVGPVQRPQEKRAGAVLVRRDGARRFTTIGVIELLER